MQRKCLTSYGIRRRKTLTCHPNGVKLGKLNAKSKIENRGITEGKQ